MAAFFYFKNCQKIRYTIMKVKLNIPTKLSEITLEQYQAFLAAQEISQEENYLEGKAVEIFCNIPPESVRLITAHSISDVTSKISAIFSQKPELVRFFTLNKKEYGFIPNLDEMSFGEYIDVDTYLSDWKNMHFAMNVLYRPVVHKSAGRYELSAYDTETRDRALQMPMDAVLGSIFFLFNLGTDLLKVTQNYLKEEVEKQRVHYPNLDRNGVGITHFMDLVTETLNGLSLYQK